MHLPSHLPQPNAVAVESVFPHGKLQEVLLVQNWAAVRGSWKTAMRRDHKTMKTLYTHFTYNYNNMEDTAQLLPLGTKLEIHTNSCTHTHWTTHTHTPHKLTNALTSVSIVYQDILRCLMRDLAKFANFHFGKSSPLSGTRLFWTKLPIFNCEIFNFEINLEFTRKMFPLYSTYYIYAYLSHSQLLPPQKRHMGRHTSHSRYNCRRNV